VTNKSFDAHTDSGVNWDQTILIAAQRCWSTAFSNRTALLTAVSDGQEGSRRIAFRRIHSDGMRAFSLTTTAFVPGPTGGDSSGPSMMYSGMVAVPSTVPVLSTSWSSNVADPVDSVPAPAVLLDAAS
jgi:hypothetical protein